MNKPAKIAALVSSLLLAGAFVAYKTWSAPAPAPAPTPTPAPAPVDAETTTTEKEPEVPADPAKRAAYFGGSKSMPIFEEDDAAKAVKPTK